jgi:hypothetical protein
MPGERIGMFAHNTACQGKTDHLGWSGIAQEEITGITCKTNREKASRPSPDI